MIDEVNYTKGVSAEHIKALGQYFTNYAVAEFMCLWACNDAKNMLDPAVGNSIFFINTKKCNPKCFLHGYEIDKKILEYFGNPTEADIINDDYLLNGWENKYDAIVCNPPYNKFQAVSNRDEIVEQIYMKTGIRCSKNTNLYALFLVKSIFQLSDEGKLAYIIPSEFLNSEYGTPIKQMLIDKHLLKAVINFKNNKEMFFNATTTCCIVLIDKKQKDYVDFYNLSAIDELEELDIENENCNSTRISYEKLDARKKWRHFINIETESEYSNTVNVSEFCVASRGIATGANSYFCLSLQKAQQLGIPMQHLSKCICKSADVKTAVFTDDDFNELSDLGKNVYLLDIKDNNSLSVREYIEYGETLGIDKKYLPSCRKPWFSMEQKQVAPIWVSPACRGNIKFVRNLSDTKALTTFHSIFINESYREYMDLLFCYFLTPVAQKIIRENRKELGNGLDKFQPGDLNNARMLDINTISLEDIQKVYKIYADMKNAVSSIHIEKLNSIFLNYLI